MKAIGIAGYATSGKTTVATYLEREFGYERRHIATPLRGMLSVLLKAFGLDDLSIWGYLEGPLKEQVIPELGVTSRHAQITLGTEWARECIGPGTWVNAWVSQIKPGDQVINDSVRFPNEADAIRKLGGIVIKVERPGVGPIKFNHLVGKLAYKWFGMMWGAHDSERLDRIKADYTIVNDGTLAQLQEKIDTIMFARDNKLPQRAYKQAA